MIPLSLARIAEITRGRLDGASPETIVAGPVVIDSRQAALARGGRAFAVLGEMAELGASTVGEHEKIGAYAARGGLAGLIAVGETAAAVLKGAEQVGTWTGERVQVEDVGAAAAALGERLRPGDVVLIKGSRVAGLERVAQAVLAAEPPEGGDGA